MSTASEGGAFGEMERNKAVVRRFYTEPLEERRSGVLEELVTDDFVDSTAESAEEQAPGPEGVKRANDRFLEAFGDFRVTIGDQIAEGDKVATRWSAEAVHQGTFMGIPPTGKRVRVTGIGIHLVRDGRIAAEWEEWDVASLRAQLEGASKK